MTPFESALIQAINKHFTKAEQKELFFYDEGFSIEDIKNYPEDFSTAKTFVDELGLLDIEGIDHVGGEGEGSTFYSIYSFSTKTEKAYIKFDGSYSSYNGCEYERFFLVEPKLVTITEYYPKA